jgi:xanthine dehydrogenase small subunit
MGTKIGCREGDCGACTMLVGTLEGEVVKYHSVTSCLMPLGNAHGKHIVTIEGINLEKLNIVQQAFSDNAATQCGFCTPGFIMSLTGFCLDDKIPTNENAIDAVNGNICRCTGYKSIEKAAVSVSYQLQERAHANPIEFAVKNNIVPEYFLNIPSMLKNIQPVVYSGSEIKKVGGGTDLYVQQHDTITHEKIDFLLNQPQLKGIQQNGNICTMGGATTVSEISDSPVFNEYFKDLNKYIKLVSSTPIRNMATVAGNFTNASPIGDLTILFLALDAQLQLNDGNSTRNIPLRSFYKGYKQLDKNENEIIEKISFELPSASDLFNFEKVCKRTHLDIASVNSALSIKMNGAVIEKAGISAGGVGPIPMYLSKSSEFLFEKTVSEKLIFELIEVVQSEISPISDARGTVKYKRLLLSQLIKAHFIQSFSHIDVKKLLKN